MARTPLTEFVAAGATPEALAEFGHGRSSGHTVAERRKCEKPCTVCGCQPEGFTIAANCCGYGAENSGNRQGGQQCTFGFPSQRSRQCKCRSFESRRSEPLLADKVPNTASRTTTAVVLPSFLVFDPSRRAKRDSLSCKS